MHTSAAIITGASEGLGKFMAIEMASRGYHLVLVALPGTGLPQLAQFLIKNFSICAHYFEMDLTEVDNCVALFQSLRTQHIQADILINNAGIGNNDWFDDKCICFYAKQITLNVMAPVVLTRLFIDHPCHAKQRYILNVGSLGGIFVVPKKGVYGATKSFIRHFTKSLQIELRNTNISISLLSPGGINTKPELLVLHDSLKGISRVTVLEPEVVAKKAIDGMFKGKKEIIPGIFNRIFVWLKGLLPNIIQEMIIHRNMKNVL
ncbi:SDR family NAD(P)-dependent oxidoreductase [Ilyomonas limi]|uniref:SDR family NAD(P)-dependent oxidoreductase n=1 Tax=Ilyomonas limi TaxID=2575867 RepID=A0A4U3LCF1_9BACT|nr:SDR family NAD(P)-dependent oxidoreductase [Ilyomonas limi]TKK71547.1 SDR family NAD(P)-dependent oxidoreductase [Ilyomonas limi]